MGASLPVSLTTAHRLRQQITQQRQRLLGIAYSWCHDAMLAEDLVHETLVRALEKVDGLRDHDRFEVWVTRIMVNLYRDWHRRKSPVVGIDFDVAAPGDDPEQDVERLHVVRRIRNAVERLGGPQRLDTGGGHRFTAASRRPVAIGVVDRARARALAGPTSGPRG